MPGRTLTKRSRKIRIAIIEDNRLLRDVLTAMLTEQPDMTVVATTGKEDVRTLRKLTRPDIVLLSLGMQSRDGMPAVETVKAHHPAARIIVMDLSPEHSELMDYVRAGASGFVLEDATFDDFLRTIRAVARGSSVLPPSLIQGLFAEITHRGGERKATSLPLRMTGREREVITLIAQGMSNKQIATTLHLATDTVKSHVHNILEKLGLQTRLQIASYTHAGGESDPGTRSKPHRR